MTMDPSAVAPEIGHPPAGGGRGRIFVIQTGLITTAIALGIVYWLSHKAEVNPMGFYVKFILPLGAVTVGAVAGLGYGLASSWTGAKIGRGLLLTVCALLVGAYFVAQYIEFRELDLVYEDTGERVAFIDYYHFATVTMSFTSTRSGSAPGEPLGAWGYAFRLLEIGGFVLGGLIAPLVMKSKPYCDACQRYQTTKELGLVPVTPVHAQDETKSPDAVADEAAARYERLRAFAEAGDADSFRAEIEPFANDQKAIGKMPTRTRLRLIYCKGCATGRLEGAILSGKGESVSVDLLPGANVSAAFINGMGL
ncbi:MAG TPA: hypothetical protein VGR35_01810 [Tepidisphaeraceae bacterium]|nr:hypothetical protein [Tepidisphaeraceae bacterium]